METYNNYQPPIYQPIIPLKPLKPERKSIRFYYNWAGACILITFGLEILMSLVAYLLIDNVQDGSIADGIINAVCMTFSMLSAVFICCLATNTQLHKLFNLRDVKLSTIGKVAIVDNAILPIMLLAIAGLQFLFKLMGIEEVIPDYPVDSGIATVIDIVYACIFAPILEEILFRGFVLKNLSRVSIRFGIFASAILFGLMHGNTQQFLIAGAGGVLYAYIAVKTNSIIPSILCHAFYNSMITLFDYIGKWDENIGNIVMYSWFGVTAVLSIIILAFSLNKINFPKTTALKRKRCLPLFLTSPTIIIALAFLVVLIAFNFKFIN